MEFKEYKLSELSKDNKGTYGIGASAVKYSKDLYTYLRITDIKEDGSLDYKNLKSVDDKNAEKYILKKGDIVFARTGNSTGKAYYYDGEIQNLVYAGFLIKFSLDEKKVNPKFMKYYTMTKEYKNWVKEIQTGSTRGNINEKMYGNMKVRLPSRIYQDKLVALLECLDKKIESNNQINNNLYKITRKLYEHIFITNKSEEWKKYVLTDIANIQNGYSYKGTELVEESEIGMATIKNFDRTGGFKEDGFKPLRPLKSEDVHYAKKFDVLVACTDLTQNADIIGNTVMLLSLNGYDKVIISMDLVKVVPKLEYVNNYMLYSILSSKQFKNFALGYTSGTTVLHLNKNCFKEFSIKLPDKIEIAKFVKTVEPMYLRISEIIEENKTLEKLRDTLLPKLMNGEINLDKIEI